MSLRYLIPILIGGILAFSLSNINVEEGEIMGPQRGGLPLEEDGKVIESEQLRQIAQPLEESVIQTNRALRTLKQATGTDAEIGTTTSTATTTAELPDTRPEGDEPPEFEFSNRHKGFSISTPNDPFITHLDIDPYKTGAGTNQMAVVRTRSSDEIENVNIEIEAHGGTQTYELKRIGVTSEGEEVWQGSWGALSDLNDGYILTITVESEENETVAELHML